MIQIFTAITAAAAVSLTALAMAQMPTQTTEPKTLRLTGCLAGVTGPGGGALPNNAVLNNAVPVISAADAKIADTKASNKPKPASYELTAPPSVGLAKHIGHTVEISGTITLAPHGNPDTVPPQGGKHGLREHVSVRSLRHIAAKCS